MPEDKLLKQAPAGLKVSKFARRDAQGAPAPRAADGRKSPRHAVSATAEVVEPRSSTRLTCRATDLSLGGCYLDTLNPFDAGTTAYLRLKSENRVFQTEASVLYSTPGMGMGLAFTKMTPEHQQILREWMSALGEESPEAEAVVEPAFEFAAEPKSATPVESLSEIMSGLVAMLLRKQVLTESEAIDLQKKLSRSDKNEN